MKRIIDIFTIKREERPLVVVVLLMLVALNAIVMVHYYSILTPIQKDYWNLFVRNYHVSGFDPITLSVVSDWSAGYNVYRHPLLAFFMYPAYLLNQVLMSLTGINCAIFIVGALQILSAWGAAICLFRILRQVIGVGLFGSYVLVAFYQSFAYIMLSAMVPDHFIFSSFMLLLTLYVTGRRLASGRRMKIWQTVVYFIFTAGTSLNNGLKIFISALFVNRRKFFTPRYLLFAVILPSLAIWGFCRWEYRTFVFPEWHAKKVAAERKKAEKKKAAEFAAARRDTVLQAKGKNIKILASASQAKTKAKKKRKVQGTPIANGEFSRWTDISTPRWESLVENVFGEGIQFHKRYLLQDVLTKRPVMVHYDMALNYIVEGIVILLFLCGILCGIRKTFLWTCLSYFMLDMVLHVGFGFGLNEVYIMSAHWMYVIPLAIAWLLRLKNRQLVLAVNVMLLLVTAFLYGWNVCLVCSYF